VIYSANKQTKAKTQRCKILGGGNNSHKRLHWRP